MPWDYSTIYWNFSVAFFVHTAHGCLIQMCHQNYSKLSGTFFAGEILILYRANSRFRVPPGSNLNLSLMTVQHKQCGSAVANILQYLNACFSVKWNIFFLLPCHRNVHQKCLFCVCFTFFGDLRRVCFISQHSKILSGMFLRNYLPQEPGAYWILDKLQVDEIFWSSPNRSPPKYPVNRSMRRPQQCSQNDIQQLAIL